MIKSNQKTTGFLRDIAIIYTLITTIGSSYAVDNSQTQIYNKYSLLDEQSEQVVMVITQDESAIQGRLFTYSLVNEHNKRFWQPEAIEADIVVGRTGVAWGKGLHPEQPGNQKQEGDGKAPAGIFTLDNAFGYLPQLSTHLRYSPMTENDFCIDVNGSAFYNQIVSSVDVGVELVKQSSEPMRRDIHNQDDLYKKGIVVAHNPNNISQAGSCIFVHIWRGHDKATAGCTAMAEPDLDRLLLWLDHTKSPLFITLTKAQYQQFQQQWDLPKLTNQ